MRVRFLLKTGNEMKVKVQEAEAALGPPPRKVAYSRDGIAAFWIWWGCLVAYAVLIPPFGIYHYKELRSLQTTGVPVQGTVLADWATSAQPPTYGLTYGYEYDGTGYTQRQTVFTAQYPHRRIGYSATVYVLPSDPSFSHLGPVSQGDLLQVESSWKPWSLMLVIMGFMIIRVRLVVAKQWKLLQYGETAHGTVIEIKAKSPKNTITFKYRYETAEGEKTGSATGMSRNYPEISVGSDVVLLYDPDKPVEYVLRGQLVYVRVVNPSLSLQD